MPFTLAHPAAVLPLRRYCPRYLHFGALVVGSVCPDLGYFPGFRLDEISHSFIGGFLFDLPVGMLMLAALFLLRRPMVNLLPKGHRAAFLPLCERPLGPPLVVLISLLIGIWSHLVWDVFTHRHGWLYQHLPVLQRPLVMILHRRFTLSNVCWFASSFGGVACLCVAYERWRHEAEPAAPPFSRTAAIGRALICGLLILPVEVVHYLTGGPIGLMLVGGCSLALLAGLVLFIEHDLRIRAQSSA